MNRHGAAEAVQKSGQGRKPKEHSVYRVACCLQMLLQDEEKERRQVLMLLLMMIGRGVCCGSFAIAPGRSR